MSPSDIVGPSPVTSVGTEVTEIEDDVSDDARLEFASPSSTQSSQVGIFLFARDCGGILGLTLSVAPDAENQLARSFAPIFE
jgi:hypothetical protein